MKNRSYLLFFIIISVLLTITGGCVKAGAFGTIPDPVEVPTAVQSVEIKKIAKLAPTAFPTPTNRPRNTPTLIPTLRPTATETTVPTATPQPTATTEPTATMEPTATSEAEAAAVEPTAMPAADETSAKADEASADEADADEASADEADADETSTDEADADETTADEAEADETPADEASVDEAEAMDESDSTAVAVANEVIRSPVELRTSLGCTACHNATETHDPANPVATGPNQATLHEYAGERIPGMSAEEYVYNSIVDPCSFLVEGYVACIMPPTYGDMMSEAELDGLVAWFLDPNREY